MTQERDKALTEAEKALNGALQAIREVPPELAASGPVKALEARLYLMALRHVRNLLVVGDAEAAKRVAQAVLGSEAPR